MGINIADNFQYLSQKPLDGRTKYDTTAAMKAVPDSSMYDGCMAYCSGTDKMYQWKSSNSVDSTLGRWREFETGGVDAKAYHTDDESSTTINDNCYFPYGFRSASSTAIGSPRMTLWSTIKAKLKDYFDTIYDLNKTDIPLYATCPTNDSTTRKIVTVVRGSFKQTAGAKIVVKFTYGNTAERPELLINGTVYGIYIVDENGNHVFPTTFWNANDVVTFIFDGTYLIMQPTISMSSLPVVGTITRSDLYSTTEKVVGCWTDGRPIYQKTFSGTLINTSSAGTGTFTYISTGASINNYITIEGVVRNSANNNDIILSTADTQAMIRLLGGTNATADTNIKNKIAIINGWTVSGTNTYIVTARYTKTTDAANSYNYANENDYSTSEKIVGTWVDGSYLYQRTITGTTASSGITTNVVALNSNYFVRKFEGSIRQSTGVYVQIGYTNTIEGSYTDAQKDAIFAYTDGGYVKLMHGEYNRGKTYGLTIQYTK